MCWIYAFASLGLKNLWQWPWKWYIIAGYFQLWKVHRKIHRGINWLNEFFILNPLASVISLNCIAYRKNNESSGFGESWHRNNVWPEVHGYYDAGTWVSGVKYPVLEKPDKTPPRTLLSRSTMSIVRITLLLFQLQHLCDALLSANQATEWATLSVKP